MSLVSSTDYATATALTDDKTFAALFNDNVHIKNHESRALVLPATTLTEYCYSNMFNGCTNLTTAPILPATTLAYGCYFDMFKGCTNLTTAPVLPATTLAESCYYRMFYGCNKLSSVVCLASDISAAKCLEQWLYEGGSSVSGSKTLYVDPSMTTKGTGFYYDNWNLETGWALQTYVAP